MALVNDQSSEKKGKRTSLMSCQESKCSDFETVMASTSIIILKELLEKHYTDNCNSSQPSWTATLIITSHPTVRRFSIHYGWAVDLMTQMYSHYIAVITRIMHSKMTDLLMQGVDITAETPGQRGGPVLRGEISEWLCKGFCSERITFFFKCHTQHVVSSNFKIVVF